MEILTRERRRVGVSVSGRRNGHMTKASEFVQIVEFIYGRTGKLGCCPRVAVLSRALVREWIMRRS